MLGVKTQKYLVKIITTFNYCCNYWATAPIDGIHLQRRSVEEIL